MTGCACGCYDAQFNDKQARYDLKRYRRKGPDKTTRLLLDALRSAGVQGSSLLDIGGGIGAVHHELLDAGVETATHVDAATPYLHAARDEATRRGHTDRVQFLHGDFVTLASALAPADVVTLDRVICCYPDMQLLVDASASRARRLYGTVFPHDTWPIKLLIAAFNLFKRIQGSAFRSYIHPVAAIDAVVRGQGLTPRSIRRTLMWRVTVYAR
jgi:magnesium-protoporphyrin O-methyltransferase